MNIQLLSGNLTTDPDIYRNGETVKASFDIAVNEGYFIRIISGLTRQATIPL